MLACVRTAAVFGIEACPVQVEVDVSFGLPALHHGRPARRERAREPRPRPQRDPQLRASSFPTTAITVNLAPADIRKAGSSFDLPIALGVLAASGRRHAARRSTTCCCSGELSLDGGIQPARGVLPIAAAARRDSCQRPAAARRRTHAEAAVVDGLEFFAVRSLHRGRQRAERSRRLSSRHRLRDPSPRAARRRPTATSPTCTARRWRGGRSKLRRPAATTS